MTSKRKPTPSVVDVKRALIQRQLRLLANGIVFVGPPGGLVGIRS